MADKAPHRVIKYTFTKLARGKANVKVKVKNLLTGAIVIKSFLSGNSVDEAVLEKKHLQYLYRDGDSYVVMDPVTFDQNEIEANVLGSDANYLVEGEKVWVLFWNDKIIGVELSASVVMEVVETGPGVRGDTATKVTKPATMASGLVVSVPGFINQGDKIKVNTETGEYVNRVNV